MLPLTAPYSLNASMEYSEHDGVNLQLDGNTGEIVYRYNFTKAIISVLAAGMSLLFSRCQPARRFLPFALLFLSTLLPPLVLMRVRKPWVFFLLLLCGLYVVYVPIYLPSDRNIEPQL